MATLIAIALVFGVSSLVDWTWFVPANALMGLLAAAWVIARPPLRTRLGDAALAAAEPVAASDRSRDGGPLWAPPASEPAPPAGRRGRTGRGARRRGEWRRRAPFPWLPAAAAVLIGRARADRRLGRLPARARAPRRRRRDRSARARRDSPPRPRSREIAHDRNPLSPEPLWELGYIEQQRGRLANAEEALEEAVRVQPANAETWRRLGRFQLSTLNQPADALASFRAAYFLDPRNPASTSDFLEASRANGGAGALPPASP